MEGARAIGPRWPKAEVGGTAWASLENAVRAAPAGIPDAGVPMQALGQSDFSLRTGMCTLAERSGFPGHLLLNAPTFRDAIRDLARTLPLLVDGTTKPDP